ncbi:tail protein X [Breoghania sp.]|uniref:tail protein X n=1 Tax=Breoghania sp. TaxID=2065378 RepID=UPI002AA8B698|nr:tail protein X [Breoghania sp.]
MAQVYRTKDGDSVDKVCFDYYGKSSLTTEAVFEANRGLAAHGPLLPAGLDIVLPDIEEPAATPIIRVWG